MSDLIESLMVAHLSWAPWANRSRSLICLERFTHSRSFILSDLSKSLTVAYFIWAKWANEQWANERIPSLAIWAVEAAFIFFPQQQLKRVNYSWQELHWPLEKKRRKKTRNIQASASVCRLPKILFIGLTYVRKSFILLRCYVQISIFHVL